MPKARPRAFRRRIADRSVLWDRFIADMPACIVVITLDYYQEASQKFCHKTSAS